MDMRLLWAWSNHFASYKQTGVFTVLIYLHLFFLALGASGLAEGSVIAGKVPASTLVELQWSSSIHGFEGAQYLVLPRTHLKDLKLNPTNHITQDVDLDFWILPNRDLHPSRQLALTREQLEFSQANVTVEWPLSEIGLGAVTVRQVDVSDSDDLCSGREASTLTWDKHSQWSTASIERRNFERSLRVNISPKKESRCVALRIFFQFFPRDGIGNFAMQRRSGGTLSGPVHLLLKSGPLPTKVRFRDRSKQLKMSCLRCTEGKEGWTEVAYEGLPPVLEFSSVDTPEDTLSFEGSSIFKLESETHSAKLKEMANDVEESVKLFQPAVTKLFAESGTVWRFRLKPEILIEQLLIGQPGDIQMGPAYGEFGLFLDSFQQAALFREIARNFLRHAIHQSSMGQLITWSKFEENERWVRIIAEVWVTEFFPNIFNIKKIASRFSFLPFFKDLESGKALLNNNIFMGREETGSGPDFNFMNEFFSPMTGAELIFRMKSCARPDDFELLIQSAMGVARGSNSVQTFMSSVLNRRAHKDCTALMQEGLFPQDVVSESVRVDNLKDGITITREVDAIAYSKKFLVHADKPIERERIAVDFQDTDSVKRHLLPLPADEKKHSHTLAAKNPLKVSVVMPVRSVSSNKFVWPRPIGFALQSIALNYDSRQDDISAKSQVSFFQDGDDWSKNVSLGYKRIYSKNQVNLQFSSKVPSLLSKFESSISIQSNVELTRDSPAYLALTLDSSNARAGVLYPEGVSFQASLRRPISISAYDKRMSDPNREFIFGYSLGLAPRLTWRETLTYGASDLGVDVGLRDLPAWPEGEFVSKEYGLVRSEIFHTLAHNHVVPLMRTVIFQHAVLYAAHVLTFDSIEPLDETKVGGRTAQSMSAGVRLYGALLGAKNQSLSFEVARGLSAAPKTSYSVAIGRSIN